MSLSSRDGRRATAALEFALIVPVLVFLVLAVADIGIYFRNWFLLEATAASISNITSQYLNLYTSDFTTLFAAAQSMAGSTLDVTGLDGATIISCVSNNGGTQTVTWQEREGNIIYASTIGTTGSVAVLPGNNLIPQGQTMIAVEEISAVSPWVLSASYFGGASWPPLRGYALYPPRLASLNTITSGTRP
jgi:Flp pilus assembly protein TadG